MTTPLLPNGSHESGPAPAPSAAEREARRAVALNKVLRCFELSATEASAGDLTSFSTSVDGPGRLYGGTSFALAYLAAAATVEESRRLHSINGSFLRVGRSDSALDCDVSTVRDGRSFSNRRMLVRQGRRSLFEGTASFRSPITQPTSATGASRGSAHQRTGISHSIAAPPEDLPAPEECLDREQERTRKLGAAWLEHPVNAVEVRVTDPRHVQPEVQLAPRAVNWVRAPGSRDLSPKLAIAMLLYASDRALLSTAALPHGILWSKSQAVTLNHSLWLHHLPNLQHWHLFVAESRIAVDGLALIELEVFDGQGTLIATAVQEALVQY